MKVLCIGGPMDGQTVNVNGDLFVADDGFNGRRVYTIRKYVLLYRLLHVAVCDTVMTETQVADKLWEHLISDTAKNLNPERAGTPRA